MNTKRWIAIVAMLTSMAACQSNRIDPAEYQRWVQNNYSAKVLERLLPEASRLAKDRYMGVGAQWEFIASFFDGYESGAKQLSGITIIGNGKGVDQRGFDAGKRHYGQAGDLTLLDFGYELVEKAGTFTRTNFEESAFRPDGVDELWWADFRNGLWDKWTHEKSGVLYVENARLVIRGYLDPRKGGLGHFNMYDREIVVVEIVDFSR